MGALYQGVLQEKSVRTCPRDQSLVKNVTAFCPYPKHLPNAKVKSFLLIPLAVEISKQRNIDSVFWLLMLSVKKIYSEKDQAEQGKSVRYTI